MKVTWSGLQPLVAINLGVFITRIGLLTTGVVLLVPHCGNSHNVPLGGDVVLLKVHAHLDVVIAAMLVDVTQVHHVTIIGPASKLHEALLLIKWEELDINLTGRLVNGRRVPSDFARVVKYSLRHNCDFIVTISTERKSSFSSESLKQILQNWLS